MAKLRSGKPEGMETRIEDPAVLREALQGMFDAETEFPIRVEGTQTLPYFSTLKSLQWDQGSMVLKLVRPLPHELLLGAVFHFLCASGEQRFEGYITYRGREGYLQYAFEIPKFLILSDRRVHKRYPFRPRENAYVILQDSGIPGLGVAGPLVNIGLGGLALRVDRILKLDTGVRIPPATHLLERGKGFPRVRIQDLPRVHLLEVRGVAAHAYERGSEIILGITFQALKAEEEAQLRLALEVREHMHQSPSGAVRAEGGAVALRHAEGAPPALAAAPALPVPSASEGETAVRLRRRSSTLALVAAPGPARHHLEERLREAGFHRLRVAPSLVELQTPDPLHPGPPRLVIVDLAMAHTGDAEPLEAVRAIENALAPLGPVPTVILCESVDPTLLLAQAERTRFAAPGLPQESLDTLDGLLAD